MPETSTGCLLSAMFGDIIRASIHDRDTFWPPDIMAVITLPGHDPRQPCSISPLEEGQNPLLAKRSLWEATGDKHSRGY